MSNALATANGHEVDFLSDEKVALIKRTVFPNATDLELEMFLNLARTKRLDPLTNQIYAVKYGNEKASMFASIDGLRIIAQRTGAYGGQTAPYWCGPDMVWREVWLDDTPPAAAKIGVYRKGFSEPTWGVATWKSYAYDRRGQQKGNNWKSMPDVMLAKCAESIALRKAFPDDLSGLYVREEFTEDKPAEEAITPRAASFMADVIKADMEIRGQANPLDRDIIDVDVETGEIAESPISQKQLRRLVELKTGLNWTIQQMRDFSAKQPHKKANSNELTEREADALIAELEAHQDRLLDPNGSESVQEVLMG